MPNPTSPTDPARPTVREPQLVLEDLTSELLWTRVLRTPGLAARPSRVLLGMAAALIATLIGTLPTLWTDEPAIGPRIAGGVASSLQEAVAGIANLSVDGLVTAVTSFMLLPGRLLMDRPAETILLGIPMVVVLALFGGAISRAVSVEFATGRFTEWPQDLRASLSKLGSSSAAMLAPFALAGVLVGVIALGGFLLGVPVLDVLAAVLYGAALVLALFALGVLVLQTLALPMLTPAMMVEGTDGFDAVQRCYAYIIGHPLRLLAHAVLLLLLGAVSIGLAVIFAGGADRLARWAASRFTADAGLRVLEGAGDLAATQPVAHAVLEFWTSLLQLTVSGFAISYFFAAGTTLYLAARRICDGQEINELWNPATDPR